MATSNLHGDVRTANARLRIAANEATLIAERFRELGVFTRPAPAAS
jgi:hypothetical protein